MPTQKLPGLPDVAQVGVLDLPGLGPVPIVEMAMFDERAGCKLGHYYQAGELEGTPEQYQGCHFYKAGGCKINGRPARDACLFHLAETAPEWAKLRRWVLLELPDASTALTTRYSAPTVAADLGARIVGAMEVTTRL